MPAKPQAQPGTIRLVAGLGNPGDEYANTRHNAGFRAIDALGERLSGREVAVYVDGRKLASTIARPMNQQLGVLAARGY